MNVLSSRILNMRFVCSLTSPSKRYRRPSTIPQRLFRLWIKLKTFCCGLVAAAWRLELFAMAKLNSELRFRFLDGKTFFAWHLTRFVSMEQAVSKLCGV